MDSEAERLNSSHDWTTVIWNAQPRSRGSDLRADCTSLPSSFPASPLPRLGVVLALTLAFMIVEAVGGWISGSLALLADAGHMLTDAGALGLTLLSAWIALRPASHSKTYGYQRWEILAALINGAALFGIAGLGRGRGGSADPAPRADPGGPLPDRCGRVAWW